MRTTMKWWTCPKCGLEMSFEEVCKSDGHDCEEEGEHDANNNNLSRHHGGD